MTIQEANKSFVAYCWIQAERMTIEEAKDLLEELIKTQPQVVASCKEMIKKHVENNEKQQIFSDLIFWDSSIPQIEKIVRSQWNKIAEIYKINLDTELLADRIKEEALIGYFRIGYFRNSVEV